MTDPRARLPGESGGDVAGRFIALEGVEGAGKTTQIALLSAWMDDVGVRHVTAREPGGTPVGEAIRAVLLDRLELEIPERTELLLMAAARAAFLQQVVRPALDSGAWVLADRSELSTLAYQGYGRGLALDEIRSVNAVATGGLRPELTLVLDVSVEVGMERQRTEGRAGDRIERAGAPFLQRVGAGYRTLAETDPRVVLLDGAAPMERVQSSIRSALASRFPETFGRAGR